MECYQTVVSTVMLSPMSTSAKRNSSYSTYSILFLTYTYYFRGKKGISRNKMIYFFLMHTMPLVLKKKASKPRVKLEVEIVRKM